MITKELIKDILSNSEFDGERVLTNALNKALSPLVIIEPNEKAERLYEIINGVEDKAQKKAKEAEKKARLKEDYEKFENELLDYWNTFTKRFPVLSAVVKLGKDRRKHLKQRFSEEHYRSHYKAAIDQIGKCPFLLGDNDRKWKVNFDFVISNDKNYVKILEGVYGTAGQVKRGIEDFIKKD